VKRSTTIAALLLALAMLAGACGSGRSESAEPAAQTGTTETAARDTTFGDLASPCGEGDASGATAQGVTDTEIRIATIDDAGFQTQPGLNHELTDAVRGMVEWCNGQGGINGREVVLDYYDAKLFDATNAMSEACAKDFFLVGQLMALDETAEPTRRDCGLPSSPNSTVSMFASNAPLMYAAAPNPADYVSIAGAALLAEEYPEEITKGALLTANYPSAVINQAKAAPNMEEELGYEWLCRVEYNISGEPDWRPIIQRLKDCGAELVYFAGSPEPNLENLLDAASLLDFDPVWWTEPSSYVSNFADWNVDGLADRVYFGQTLAPLEEADANQAMADYKAMLAAVDGDEAGLAVSSASAFLLWATAAQACDSGLTRECVLDQMAKVDSWTGGGLHPENDPAGNRQSGCGILMKLTGTRFERVAPTEVDTYTCDDSWLAPSPPDVVASANLDSARIAQP
jgi:ABC-type branched-subunit amino acid transport system substrate-binding protein